MLVLNITNVNNNNFQCSIFKWISTKLHSILIHVPDCDHGQWYHACWLSSLMILDLQFGSMSQLKQHWHYVIIAQVTVIFLSAWKLTHLLKSSCIKHLEIFSWLPFHSLPFLVQHILWFWQAAAFSDMQACQWNWSRWRVLCYNSKKAGCWKSLWE